MVPCRRGAQGIGCKVSHSRDGTRLHGPRMLHTRAMHPSNPIQGAPLRTNTRPTQTPRMPCAPRTLASQKVPVVVKSYRPCVVATPEDFRELLMEAGKLARLDHP